MKKTKHPGLYRLPDSRFRLRATAVCKRTGKMKEATKTLEKGTTEERALLELAQLRISLREEREERRGPRRQSVNDFVVRWLEVKASRKLKPSVAARYEHSLGNHILPHIGELYVDELTRDDIMAWVAWAESATMEDGQGFSKATVTGWWRLLRQVVKDAAATCRVPDPTYRVEPPLVNAGTRRENRTLTAAQLDQLLQMVEAYSPDRYAEVYLLAYTGMRSGELYALRMEDLDEERRVIKIQRSVWQGIVGDTKTGSPREVALTSEMARILKEHRVRTVPTRSRGIDSGIIFLSTRGTYRTSSSLHKALSLAAEAAGIEVKVTPQVLRRTFNTLAVNAGVDRIVLRSMMGHCSEEMTEHYSGISPEAKSKAVALIMKQGTQES